MSVATKSFKKVLLWTLCLTPLLFIAFQSVWLDKLAPAERGLKHSLVSLVPRVPELEFEFDGNISSSEGNVSNHFLDMSHVKEMAGIEPQRFDKSKLKTILVWNNAYGNMKESMKTLGDPEELLEAGCPQPNCVLVANRSLMPVEQFDAIIFHYRSMTLDDWPKARSRHQRYIFREMEAASYISQLPDKYDKLFNWTFTYRLDSDIPKPYSMVKKLTAKEKQSLSPSSPPSLAKKTKMAVWFVSNCVSRSGRGKVAKHLQSYLPVDIYGACGPFKCERKVKGGLERCYKMMEKDYKFYLSFENSLCKDYVTEKLFNVLEYNIIPVVFGSADYKKIAPPHSVVNALDFPSVSRLADYLLYLASNETAYNEYFEWKKDYKVVDEYTVKASQMCHLCYKLHSDSEEKVYDDLLKWFITDSNCKHTKNTKAQPIITPKGFLQ